MTKEIEDLAVSGLWTKEDLLKLIKKVQERERERCIDEGIVSLLRIQCNLPVTDPILQNRKKVDYEIKRLKLIKND